MATSADLFKLAVHHHQNGNLAQAEPLYRQVIAAEPRHANAHHLLGILAQQTGHHEPAAALVRQAIALNATPLIFHSHLGMIYKEQGKLAEAAACYQHVVALAPTDVEAHNNLAFILLAQKKLAEAAAAFERVLQINPRFAEAHNNLGNVLKELGRPADAAVSFQRALALNPRYPDAHNNLGNILQQQGQFDVALEHFRRALALDPNHAAAHCNMGLTYKEMGRSADAVRCYERALQVDPRHADAHNNLGIAHKDQGRPDLAVECYRQALRCKPDHASAHNNLGYVLYDQGKTAEAIACYREALHYEPGHAEAHNNLGIALIEEGRLAEAGECFRQALRSNPALADAHSNLANELTTEGRIAEAAACQAQALALNSGHKVALWNRSCLRLLQGDFAGGWPDYELRWEQPGMVRPPYEQPRWDGAPLEGKTILVYAEQGFGDTLQFVRYLPLVKERGGTVLFLCQPALARLLSGLTGMDRLIPDGQPLPSFDVHIPLLSLPGLFGTTLATLPAQVPYVHAEPALVETWRNRLEHPAGLNSATPAFRVGIVWQGNPRFRADRQRSIPLRYFAPLARIPGVQLVSLQKGPGALQIQDLQDPFPILDIGERLETFSDTAAVMKNLDLVVSSCTSVPHLAGALGVPVWLALQLSPDWRWLLDRDDTPWYPSMRLFRQHQLGDWDSVFRRIEQALRDRLSTKD